MAHQMTGWANTAAKLSFFGAALAHLACLVNQLCFPFLIKGKCLRSMRKTSSIETKGVHMVRVNSEEEKKKTI